MLLDVKGSLTATPAERVRLVVALSETGGTLRHFGWGLVTLLLVSRVGVVRSEERRVGKECRN